MSPPDIPPAFVDTYPGNTTSIGNYALQLGGSLSGRLLNPDGTPAAGVELGLANLLVENWQWAFTYSATTDANGSFRFWHLPAIAAYTFIGLATADPIVGTTGYLVESANDTALGDITLAGPTGTAVATVTVTPSAAPQVGIPTTVDVAVSGASGVPTGTVEVQGYPGPVALDGAGHATVTYTPRGSASVAYSGDSVYGAATSAPLAATSPAGAPTLEDWGNDDASTTYGGHLDLQGTGLGAGTTFTLDGIPIAGTANAAGTAVSFTLPPHVGGNAYVAATNAAGTSSSVVARYARDGAHPAISTATPAAPPTPSAPTPSRWRRR